MKSQILLSTGALLLSVTASMAATSDLASHRRADFYAPGTHQFYAWCADGRDRLVAGAGLSAKDAETRLPQALTGGCRLSWQGRIKS